MEHGHDQPAEQVTGTATATATATEAAEQLLAALERKVADAPTDALAMIRSIFTHPDATGEIRAAMIAQQRQAADHLSADDADLRAGLIGAITLGVVIGRHLLRLDALTDAPPAHITALLRPAFHDIAHGGDTAHGDPGHPH
ncbi:TetR/AcrR family transcriptional regulator [Nocardia arizonensis]|uniref:TetR/AcrR family transcriptional regulator n=1 Tax=Nocardia arizonensis TaxID=1141647 RepID=UPI0006D2033D|nr:hypothetical protein [Nocardia arizonensis]